MKIYELDVNTVKQFMKIDYDDDDQIISNMILAAKSYIQTLLGTSFDVNSEDIPTEFTIACLMLIAHWYEHRQIQGDKNVGKELKYMFADLLSMHSKVL